jgi:hypothetical protein
MATERLAEFLNRRSRLLTTEIEQLRARLKPREVELEQIKKIHIARGNYAAALPVRLPLAGKSENSLDGFLERREDELRQQIAAINGELGPKEQEFAEIRQAQKIAASSDDQPASDATPTDSEAPLDIRLYDSYKDMTIKELILAALDSGHFPDGAAPAEIRKFIYNAYNREVPSASLSPQLSRLKADRQLLHDEQSDKWSTTLRHELLYDHPTSIARREAELKDGEPPSWEGALSFMVAKAFNSTTQRFREGMDLNFKDQADLDAFKKSILPLDFDHFVRRGFLVVRV